MMASLIIIITLLTSELQAISQFAAQYFSAFPTNVNVMSISKIRNNLNFTFFSLQATRTLPHVIQVRWSMALKVQRSYLPTPLASYVTISWKGSNERRIHNIVFFLPLILIMFITTPGTTIEYGPLVTKYICTRPPFQILRNKWQKDISVKQCNTGMWKGAKKGTWLANATVVVFSFFLFFGNFPFTSFPFYSEANSPPIPVKNYIMSNWQRNRWRFVTNSNIC